MPLNLQPPRFAARRTMRRRVPLHPHLSFYVRTRLELINKQDCYILGNEGPKPGRTRPLSCQEAVKSGCGAQLSLANCGVASRHCCLELSTTETTSWEAGVRWWWKSAGRWIGRVENIGRSSGSLNMRCQHTYQSTDVGDSAVSRNERVLCVSLPLPALPRRSGLAGSLGLARQQVSE